MPTDRTRDDGDKWKRKQTKSVTCHLKTRKQRFFYSDGSKTLAWRDGEVSLSGDTQNLTGEGPGQAAQAEILVQMILRGPFKLKGYCDSPYRRKAFEER